MLYYFARKGDGIIKNSPKPMSEPRRTRPALTPEARENQLVSRAVDLAEQQLLNGTASSQVITHFLKIGSTREKYELERLKSENALLTAKTEAIQSGEKLEELYKNAIKAMRNYGGNGGEDDNEESEDY